MEQGVQAVEESIIANTEAQQPQDESNAGDLKEEHPQRIRKQTQKMQEFQMEEAQKKERKFFLLYDKWKMDARYFRMKLKSFMSEEEIWKLVEVLKASNKNVKSVFEEIRNKSTPSVDVRRRVDTCEAVTNELLKVAYDRAVDEEEDFDADKEQGRLHQLLSHKYAHSIYGSDASFSSYDSNKSNTTLAVKRAEAAADFEAKKANYELMVEEEKKRAAIQRLENEQRKILEDEKIALERLQAAREVNVAKVRLNVLNKEMNDDIIEFHETEPGPAVNHVAVIHTNNISPPTEQAAALNGSQPSFITVKAPPYTPVNDKSFNMDRNLPVIHTVRGTSASKSSLTGSSSTSDLSSLAQMLQENLIRNRIPAPEPFVFNGDPLKFIEWKAAFTSLITKRTVDPAEKLYYLKKYVGGHAKQVLDGTFFRNDDEAFSDAWKRLERRFGHPFTVQRAFREKLSNWPKIPTRDAEGLRHYADFLNTCLEAIPHVKGLDILNDCEENQKLISKLPDWTAASWNRHVTQSLMEKNSFPSFKDFVSFLTLEADIACNPITSLHALHSEKRYQAEMKRPRASILTTQTAPRFQNNVCSFCKEESHQLYMCSKFKERPVIERRAYVKENALCYGCLKRGHSVKDCRQRHSCDICSGRHPTALHDDNFGKEDDMVTPQESDAATSLRVAANTNLLTSMILPVWVSARNRPSDEILVYALLDSQSDTTFIDQSVCDRLDTPKHTVKLKLTTMSAAGMIVQSERVSGLCVRGFNLDTKIDISVAYSKDSIPLDVTHIPTCETAKRWKHFASIIGEMQPLKDCEVGLLIGYNCSRAMTPRQVITGGDEEPYAIRTDLGWSIVGGIPQYETFRDFTCYKTVVKEQPPLTPSDAVHMLESDFRDLDNDESTLSQDDIAFLNKVGEGIRKNEQGHYEMPLPFKARPVLPNNKEMALTRLNQLKRKLQQNSSYLDQYVKYMEGIIECGDAEQIEDDRCEGEKWYIPHHGVRHPKKPEKLRVVFDGSAKFRGTCLNDHLLSGPDLLNSLLGILIRFRQHPVALICDVEKMFHQFHVPEKDRDFLRFLWWKGGDLNVHPSEFRMKVHLFGAASSPGCANFGLKHLAKTNSKRFPQASEFLLRDFYVDDGLTSVRSTEEATKLAMEARDLCAHGGLRLHKFLSNDRTVVNSIPESERAPNMKNLDLSFENLPLDRALGVQWNVEADKFMFNIKFQSQPTTRRGILSTVASLYDPLGFVAPVLLKAKTILQEMCRRGVAWDDLIAEELLPHWLKWRDDLVNLTNVVIPRTYVPAKFGPICKVELHHFSDASTKGYGQCSYLRFQNEAGNVHCALVLGKSRVAPLKLTTIPRLELTAAVVSVQANGLLKRELQFPDIAEHFWTDSRVVLGYIKNEARRFHTFVANRVQKIHLGSLPEQWRYISSEENPADHASRGLTPNELLSSSWLTGPQFLWERELVFPKDEIPEISNRDPEVRTATVFDTSIVACSSLVDRLLKFSSWTSAVRAVARLLRRVKGSKEIHQSTVTERELAKRCIIKNLQETVFKNELKLLKGNHSLPMQSKLYKLDPILDQEGILRLGGRLSNSLLDESVKHPIIFPRDHHLTRLLISHCHENVKHQGKGMTINYIRSSGFWICGIGHAVSSCIFKCVRCRRQRRPTENQKMADLPQERVEPSPPFTCSGMDCFGPFVTKQGRKECKRYGLLFTCLSSRAIHIEMLEDLSTDAFINGLRCFIAIRGAVRLIRCDHGTNFVGAKNEFSNALQEFDKNRLTAYLANQQCDFVMNAPQASHAGGVWERQIRTVRNVLRMTTDLSKGLRDASLRTLFYEAMAIVNSRPLTVNTLCHPNGPQPLTPNHLLTMKTTQPLPPPGHFVPEDVYSKKQWRQVQYLAEQFWSRWRKEYLASITLRQRWHKPQRNIHVGDIVLLKNDDAFRNEWKMGRVLEAMPGNDGLVRRVRLQLGDRRPICSSEQQTKASVVERPIQKLVVLVEASDP